MRRHYWVLAASLAMMVLVSAVVAVAAPGEPAAPAAAGGDEMAKAVHSVGMAMAAALVVCVSIIGAGIAVGRIGAAAIGAAAERPELFFKSVLYVGLAEGLAILGLAMAFVLKYLS